MQQRTLETGTSRERVEWPVADGRLELWPEAFGVPEADLLLASLLEEIDWRTEEIVIFGRRQRVPRLVAWHGDPEAEYSYSGVRHPPMPWTPSLLEIRLRVEELTRTSFNSALLNRYRNGADGMGWHADDEPELGRHPVIASVSLGQTRRFALRHRRQTTRHIDLDLPHGSLLLMSGALQHHWLHALPKTRRPCGERINLTWRNVGAHRAGSARPLTPPPPIAAG